MLKKWVRLRIGLRTVKTAVAVIISMVLVDHVGTSASKLIFAMLGAMAAVQPTFKESVASCLTQIVGVLFGAVMGLLLRLLPGNHLIAVGIGIVLVITLYNSLRIPYSPSLSCFVVVMVCSPGVHHLYRLYAHCQRYGAVNLSAPGLFCPFFHGQKPVYGLYLYYAEHCRQFRRNAHPLR